MVDLDLFENKFGLPDELQTAISNIYSMMENVEFPWQEILEMVPRILSEINSEIVSSISDFLQEDHFLFLRAMEENTKITIKVAQSIGAELLDQCHIFNALRGYLFSFSPASLQTLPVESQNYYRFGIPALDTKELRERLKSENRQRNPWRNLPSEIEAFSKRHRKQIIFLLDGLAIIVPICIPKWSILALLLLLAIKYYFD